jgi:hypothetical protein
MFLGVLLLGSRQSLWNQKDKGKQSVDPMPVCETLKNRHLLHSRLVKIRGVYESSVHGAWLSEKKCSECFVIKGVTGPCAIHLVGTFKKEYLDSIRLYRLSIKRFEERWNRGQEELVHTALVEGIFITKTDDELFIGVDYLKQLRLNGFGHGNTFPAEISVKTVTLVSAKPPD